MLNTLQGPIFKKLIFSFFFCATHFFSPILQAVDSNFILAEAQQLCNPSHPELTIDFKLSKKTYCDIRNNREIMEILKNEYISIFNGKFYCSEYSNIKEINISNDLLRCYSFIFQKECGWPDIARSKMLQSLMQEWFNALIDIFDNFKNSKGESIKEFLSLDYSITSAEKYDRISKFLEERHNCFVYKPSSVKNFSNNSKLTVSEIKTKTPELDNFLYFLYEKLPTLESFDQKSKLFFPLLKNSVEYFKKKSDALSEKLKSFVEKINTISIKKDLDDITNLQNEIKKAFKKILFHIDSDSSQTFTILNSIIFDEICKDIPLTTEQSTQTEQEIKQIAATEIIKIRSTGGACIDGKSYPSGESILKKRLVQESNIGATEDFQMNLNLTKR